MIPVIKFDAATAKIFDGSLAAFFDSYRATAAELSKHWKKRLADAKKFMAACKGQDAILIEVASQHPLADGEYPGVEFQARLDRAVQIYHRYKRLGREVEIFVPGSRHMDGGVEDKISLSEAGARYLAAQGIPWVHLQSEGLIKKYKGSGVVVPEQVGVYGSHDEAYVAAHYFMDTLKFGKLIAIAGPMQARRKEMHYVALGINPTMVWAMPSDAKMHHTLSGEIESLDKVFRKDDPTYQGAGDPLAIHLRKLRMRGFLQSLAS